MDEYTRPDYQHMALITVDVQNDFALPGALLEIKGTMEIVPAIVTLLKLFRELSKSVIYIIRLYKDDGSNVDIVRRKWIAGGVQEMAPNEYAIYKPRWGAFHGTPLEKFLKMHKINTLAFKGCNFPNCQRTSIYKASERDFKLIIVRDALSGIYDKGIEELKNIGCEIVQAQYLVKKLKFA